GADLVQRIMLDENQSDSSQEQTDCANEQYVHADLTGKVRTRERDLAEVHQTELDENQADQDQRHHVPDAWPCWPQSKTDSRGSEPDRNHGENPEWTPRCPRRLPAAPRPSDLEDPVRSQIRRQAERHARADNG